MLTHGDLGATLAKLQDGRMDGLKYTNNQWSAELRYTRRDAGPRTRHFTAQTAASLFAKVIDYIEYLVTAEVC